VLARRLPVAEIFGPATLAYLDPADFSPQPDEAVTGRWTWIIPASGSS